MYSTYKMNVKFEGPNSAELCSPKIRVEAPSPSVTIYKDKACEVLKVKWGHKGGALV